MPCVRYIKPHDLKQIYDSFFNISIFLKRQY